MNITSISLSYVFIGIGAASLIAFLYFKTLVVKTSDKSESRDKIIGSMKSPDSWRSKNNAMSYVSLFWAVLSVGIFIYMKYYAGASLVSIIYPFAYVGIMAVSFGLFGAIGRRSKAQ